MFTGYKQGRLLAAILVISFLALCMFPATSHAGGGFPIIGVLHAGKRPEGIAVDTQTHMIYIGYEYPSLVVGFDPVSGKVRWSTPVGDSATDVQVDSIHHRVYAIGTVNETRRGLLAVLDGATGKILLTTNTAFGDDGLAIDAQRQQAYVSSTDRGIINAFTLVTSPGGKLSAAAATLDVGPHPQALGVNSRLG